MHGQWPDCKNLGKLKNITFSANQLYNSTIQFTGLSHCHRTRSSADADNGLDAFSSQSRSTNMVFWVHCDFSL